MENQPNKQRAPFLLAGTFRSPKLTKKTMFYFIGLGVVHKLFPQNWKVDKWLEHHKTVLSRFEISNVDVLYKLPK